MELISNLGVAMGVAYACYWLGVACARADGFKTNEDADGQLWIEVGGKRYRLVEIDKTVAGKEGAP